MGGLAGWMDEWWTNGRMDGWQVNGLMDGQAKIGSIRLIIITNQPKEGLMTMECFSQM